MTSLSDPQTLHTHRNMRRKRLRPSGTGGNSRITTREPNAVPGAIDAGGRIAHCMGRTGPE